MHVTICSTCCFNPSYEHIILFITHQYYYHDNIMILIKILNILHYVFLISLYLHFYSSRFLKVLPKFGRMFICMYVCLFDSSNTVQPAALKLWHTIPCFEYLKMGFSHFWKKNCRVIALFIYFFKISCNFEEELHKNQWR